MAEMIGVKAEISTKAFPAVAGAPPLQVFDNFHISVEPGSFVSLLGPSGIGKTTLLNIIAGLDQDFEGRITFSSGCKPRIAYAFQTPRLLPWRTVLNNILLALPDTRAARQASLALLAEMGLTHAAEVFPERLSLGMQRRVALARAFAVEPDLLLMDEPFVSLDEATADRLRDLLQRLLVKHPATVLFVTHDSREAVKLSERVVVLEGAPARVRRDIPVALSGAERHDNAVVDALRTQIHPAMESDRPIVLKDEVD